jgi:3-deoxy-D-manno-octulosonate 8-phosphate phosphatase (KDO 8-P phosphatase)
MIPDWLVEKLAKIKILLLDVDGVLTNGKLYFGNSGEIMLPFDVKDGSGIRYLTYAGVLTGIITGKNNNAVSHRARDLEVTIVHRNVKNKVAVFNEILQSHDLLPEESLYIGDDLLDLPIMERVGVSVAVADAVPEVKEAADYVTINRGGDGAVREVCEMILKAQNKWVAVVERYRSMQ